MVRTLQYKYICIHILITVVVIVYSIHGNQKFRSSILETEIEKCFNDHYTIVDLDYGAISMCGLYCMQDTNCTVACYNADTRTCLLNDKRRSHLQKTHCEHCALLWKDKEQSTYWTMIFRGTAGINLPVYDMFVIDGPLIQTTQAECQTIHTTSCNTHYRNPLLQRWKKLNIHHIKFELYKNGTSVAFMMFGGFPKDFNLTKTSWFSQQYLQNSSWDDLMSGTHATSFSIVGYRNFGVKRRFLVSKQQTGCTTEGGWMAVIDDRDCSHNCKYECVAPMSTFLYSPGKTYSVWDTGAAHADVLAIYAEIEN